MIDTVRFLVAVEALMRDANARAISYRELQKELWKPALVPERLDDAYLMLFRHASYAIGISETGICVCPASAKASGTSQMVAADALPESLQLYLRDLVFSGESPRWFTVLTPPDELPQPEGVWEDQLSLAHGLAMYLAACEFEILRALVAKRRGNRILVDQLSLSAALLLAESSEKLQGSDDAGLVDVLLQVLEVNRVRILKMPKIVARQFERCRKAYAIIEWMISLGTVLDLEAV